MSLLAWWHAAAVEAAAPPPQPAGPTHSFSMVVDNRGRGYNAVGGFGSIQAGSTATYTGNGKSLTVIHCRNVGGALNFSVSGAATGEAGRADFPARIVLTKTTGAEVERTATPGSAAPRAVTGGVRYDYTVTGSLGDVIVRNQTVRVDLYYA